MEKQYFSLSWIVIYELLNHELHVIVRIHEHVDIIISGEIIMDLLINDEP